MRIIRESILVEADDILEGCMGLLTKILDAQAEIAAARHEKPRLILPKITRIFGMEVHFVGPWLGEESEGSGQ